MTNYIRVGLVCVALVLTGCQSFYTSIEKAEDGTYILTRIQQGFLTVSGSVERCEVSGDVFKCERVAR